MLKIKPLHTSASLDLAPTPFMVGTDDPNQIWEEGVELFFHWLCGQFGADRVFGEFEVAEALNVHRIIADEWMLALYKGQRVQSVIKEMLGGVECYAFTIISSKVPAKLRRVTIKPGALVKYDPWRDRSLDAEVPDAMYADLYVDKFFDVFVNEHYIMRRKPRKRPNGRLFQPMTIFTDHPRYVGEKKEGPPALDWREPIEEAVSA